jgi:hypothetical protein
VATIRTDDGVNFFYRVVGTVPSGPAGNVQGRSSVTSLR